VNLSCAEARAGFASGVLARRGATDAPATAPSAARAAAEHIATCAACQRHFDRLARAVLSGSDDEISCAECTARLGDFVLADLAGDDTAVVMPLIHRHIAACQACAGDFRAARAAMVDLRLGRLPEPPRAPHLDMSFLRRPAAQPASRAPARVRVARGGVVLLAVLGAVLVVVRGRMTGPAATPSPGASPVAILRPGTLEGPAGAARGPTAVARIDLPAIVVTPRPAPTSPSPAALEAAAAPAPAMPILVAPATISPPFETPTPMPTPPPTLVATPGDFPGPAPRRATAGPRDTATPTPLKSPTPVLVWRCEPAFPSMLRVLTGTCEGFPNPSEYDLFQLTVATRSRWTVSLCNRTELDTVIALYVGGAFDPAAPCAGMIAFNDDHCARQSRLTVDLDPGIYALVVAEKTGDVGAPYAFKLETDETAGSACAERLAP